MGATFWSGSLALGCDHFFLTRNAAKLVNAKAGAGDFFVTFFPPTTNFLRDCEPEEPTDSSLLGELPRCGDMLVG